MKESNDITDLWRLKEVGEHYNNRIDLYSNVDKNEAFYAGDQWRGVQSNGLPTPVFNIFKRIINHFIASILSQKVSIKFSSVNSGDFDLASTVEEQDDINMGDDLTGYSDILAEKLKLNDLMAQALLDAAITGDACMYNFFDTEVETGQISKGDISCELVDNVNVFFGNPNDRRVNFNGRPVQPYILISFRQIVDNLKKEAIKNGAKEKDVERIQTDEEYLYQSGDRGKIELDRQFTSGGKTIALLKLWYDDKTKTIHAKKATKHCVIREEWDTGYKIYPVAWMNWDVRKNSYHGQAIGTNLIPNQVYINKMFAMVMLFMQQMAFPKIVYDKSIISSWSNQIGTAIGIEAGGQSVAGSVHIVQPASMSGQLMNTIEYAINYTKEMIGASDASLGNVKPENTSAIIAVSQQAAIPLENVKRHLYQFVEDIAEIWIDMMRVHYGNRKVQIKSLGRKFVKEFDFENLNDKKMQVKIDVGPSSYWSEITSMQTLDNLLRSGILNPVQYFERLPNGIVPNKQELIEDLKKQMQQMQQQPQQPQQSQQQDQTKEFEKMAQFIQSLPPDIQERLESIRQSSPEEYQKAVYELMQGGNPNAT